MKPEIKEQWITALESGNYVKGKIFLRQEVGAGLCNYCALGVLTDLYIKQHPGTQWEPAQKYEQMENPIYTFAGASRCEAAGVVMDWAGIPDDNWARFIHTDDDTETSIAQISDLSPDWAPVVDAIRTYF
jgi:hypothetical protein